MNILLIGGGGREHAIVKKLRENPSIEEIWALPGNAGFAGEAEVTGISAEDLDAVLSFAKNHPVDYAVVAPDDPLVMGMVDRLEEIGIPCFGPCQKAAMIEGSKAFSKDLMKKYHIPTAAYEVFTDLKKALDYVDTCPIPVVIKASGLAKGKGVSICEDREGARAALRAMMGEGKFGKSGETVVIEEFLEGPEVSVLSFTDGKTLVPMVSSMDHKRAFDGDRGPNTGGMGAVAPNPYYTKEVADLCMEKIFLPTIRAMAQEGRPFKGCLYFGLMLTQDGPKVIEYNCRFGDPEAQVVLPLLKSDLFTIMKAVTEEKLDQVQVSFSNARACCVVMASKGYPLSYEKGFPISFPEKLGSKIFFAGACENEGKLVTNGGRVLGVTETAPTLMDAIDRAYEDVDQIYFDNAFFRKDIGQRALKARR